MPWVKGPRGTGDFIEVKDSVRFMNSVQYMDENYLGNTYYVKGGETATDVGSDSNTGKSPDEAWLTVAYANSQLDTGDRLIILPSDNRSPYFEAEADLPIEIVKNNVQIIGGLRNERQWGTPAMHTHGTTSMFQIDAHNVEIAGLGFHMQGAAPCAIEMSPTGNYWGHYVHHCYFGGNSALLCGITMGNSAGSGYGTLADSYDAPCSVVEDCYFIYINGACIYMEAGYGSVVRRCSFAIGTGDYGIEYGTDGASRPFAEIVDNRFTTSDSTNAIGIKMSHTPTTGHLVVDGNKFVNFADNDHCISVRTNLTGLNYLGLTAIAIT